MNWPHTAKEIKQQLHSGSKKGLKYIFFQILCSGFKNAMPERIYNPITAMGFSAMFTFQLDKTKR